MFDRLTESLLHGTKVNMSTFAAAETFFGFKLRVKLHHFLQIFFLSLSGVEWSRS